MLYTVLRPDAGDALIDGHSAVRTPLEAAAAPGGAARTARASTRTSARARTSSTSPRSTGSARAAARARAAELLRLLEMEEFADRRAKGFSQGERVKTALARSLVHRPRNLILDEPTNGLDVMAVRALRRLLRQLRDAGHCVLFSSHVMQEVSALCDEVVVIAAGAVLASGTPAGDPRRAPARARSRTPSCSSSAARRTLKPCAPSSSFSSRSFARTCASGARCSPR